MTFQAPLRVRTMGDADFHVLDVPPSVEQKLPHERVLVTVNGGLTWHAPLLPLGDGRGTYLVINVERRRQLRIAVGERVTVVLEPDDSPYGMPVPDEWRALLAEDAELRTRFEALSPGKQRRLLYTVGKPRTEATRLRKAVGAAAYLHEVGSAGFSYQGLLAALKRNR